MQTSPIKSSKPTSNKRSVQHESALVFEQAAWAKNLLACGIDEVGRGCLAGPVVIGAAVLHPGATHPLVRDSKAMTAAQRDEAYAWIVQHAWVTTAVIDVATIEQRNIYQATLYGMRKALAQILALVPGGMMCFDAVLVDAMPLRYPLIPDIAIHHWPEGERRSMSVAAASIVAKVTRDRLMARLALQFPAYGLEAHKGYATAQHLAAVSAAGLSIMHRPSFCHGAHATEEFHEQKSLF